MRPALPGRGVGAMPAEPAGLLVVGRLDPRGGQRVRLHLAVWLLETQHVGGLVSGRHRRRPHLRQRLDIAGQPHHPQAGQCDAGDKDDQSSQTVEAGDLQCGPLVVGRGDRIPG